MQSGRYLESSAASGQHDAKRLRAWQLYHSSLARLIETGQQYGRLQPGGRLVVNTPSGAVEIPVVHHGFTWQPEDFSRLILVGDYAAHGLSRVNRHSGLGVPVVVLRQGSCKQRFHDEQHLFAATVVLGPSPDTAVDGGTEALSAEPGGDAPTLPGPTLHLYDPVRIHTAAMGHWRFPLREDKTAPYALLLNTRQRDFFQEFLQPGRTDSKSRLIMTEPYQPGKIPLVFVHGLLSDPMTWVGLAAEIRARPRLVDRYQIWAFQYPTGEAFLRSAATLREELRAARETLDPEHRDVGLSEMVLVGHSMGGLISKLQVTRSGNTIWRSVANRPLDQIVASPEQRRRLQTLFFFEPLPCVKRVVFMGTPHRGSALANRLLGRVGASLVRERSDREMNYQQLLQNNPNTFSPEVSKGIPTSLDLLEPDNPILVAMQRLCVNPEVRLHSIIGTGKPMLLGGPADGVVTVASARHADVETERFVPAEHVGIQRHPETVDELLGILTRHPDCLAATGQMTTARTSFPNTIWISP